MTGQVYCCSKCGKTKDGGRHHTYWSLCIACGRLFAKEIIEAKLEVLRKEIHRDIELEGYPIIVK